MSQISLGDLIKDDRLRGGEIRVGERGQKLSGRIAAVEVKGDDLIFHLHWSAKHDEKKQRWVASENTFAVILDMRVTTAIVDRAGVFVLHNPHVDTCLIFLNKGEILQVENVEGLDLRRLPQPSVVEFHDDTDEVMIS